MPRGGKRPGAGAPKGNFNALKHGCRSRQFARIFEPIVASPTTRKTLLRLLDPHDTQVRKADELAAHLLSQVVARGLKRGRDRLHPERGVGLIVLPPVVDGPTIKKLHECVNSLIERKPLAYPPPQPPRSTTQNTQPEREDE